MFTYENITNLSNKAAIELAYTSITEGWTRRGYPPIKLGRGTIPWALNNQQERSWNFYIHSWDMLDAILKAYSESGERELLLVALNVAMDWVEYLRTAPEVSPFAWYDMAVGLRAYRLAFLFQAADNAGLLGTDSRSKLWSELEAHQTYLSEDKNIVFHNNHGFYQAAGQLAMGRRFADESELMAQALSQGKMRLLKMLDTQFADDGVHLEHSPDYHRMVYSTLRGVLDAGLIDDPKILDFAGRIEQALYWFVLPNQKLANFGDSDYRSMSMTAKSACERWRTDAMRFAASGGVCGVPPEKSMVAFEKGGFFVVKTPLKVPSSHQSHWGYLAQQAAFHSRTHKHADTLSFIWHDRGIDILVDAGRYGYLGKTEQGSELWLDGHWYSDPNRIYCESTRAHNTVEFDRKNYPRKGIRPAGSLVRRHLHDQSGVYMLETEARHMRGLLHARILFYKPGQWLIVFDWFKNNLGENHDVRQWFHLSPGLKAQRDGRGYTASSKDLDVPLQICSLWEETNASNVISAQKVPYMQGWWSPLERELIPIDAICFEGEKKEQGMFATLFTFSKSINYELKQTTVSKSGRAGCFSWKDDNGEHVLKFTRKQGDCKLTLNYRNLCKENNFIQKFLKKINSDVF